MWFLEDKTQSAESTVNSYSVTSTSGWPIRRGRTVATVRSPYLPLASLVPNVSYGDKLTSVIILSHCPNYIFVF